MNIQNPKDDQFNSLVEDHNSEPGKSKPPIPQRPVTVFRSPHFIFNSITVSRPPVFDLKILVPIPR
jgi:hypothetical protein